MDARTTVCVAALGCIATIWILEGFLLVLSLLEARGWLRRDQMELVIRSFAAVSCVLFISISGFSYAQANAAQAASAHLDHVPQETITFTLPVYVSSIAAAVGFTWVVARYNAKREQAADKLADEVRVLSQIVRKLQGDPRHDHSVPPEGPQG